MNAARALQESHSYDSSLAADELEVIETYRKAKRMMYSDVLITVQEGVRVKLWLTEKRK